MRASGPLQKALERQKELVELRQKVADLERKLRESVEAGPAVVPPPPVGFNPAVDTDVVDGVEFVSKPMPKKREQAGRKRGVAAGSEGSGQAKRQRDAPSPLQKPIKCSDPGPGSVTVLND